VSAIRLLFVLTEPVRGGIEEVVLSLLRRLPADEFRVGLAAPAALLDALSPDLRGVRVDVEPSDPYTRAGLARLGRFMRRFRPTVVNPHLFRSTAVAAPLARWHGARVVETYHGREAWRRGFLPDRLVNRLVHRVIAVSEAARAFLVHGKGYPPSKITVIPNGRDLSVFRPGQAREAVRKELSLDRTVPLVGVVGRLETQKGHTYILQAWSEIVREFPDARLLVVGDGALREPLQKHAWVVGAADSVMFAGFRADIPRLLDAMDIVCLPSLFEGMPLTVIEAAAMARPVVATAVDGTPEVVRDGRTGRLVPPADPPALAQALLELLRDPERARRMGQAARDWALLRFDLDRQVAATAHVYRRVAR
jgi:glycosyltransferase involved in cell wall biosynthesis